jgi:hypothetical protein
MLRHISDITYFSDERTCPRSIPEAATAQDQAVSPPILETPRTLTFAELQTLIEQGKTDEIPNNKHIPDVINVVSISYAVLGNNMLSIIFYDRRPLPASRSPHSAKSPGSSHCNQNDVRRCRAALAFRPPVGCRATTVLHSLSSTRTCTAAG